MSGRPIAGSAVSGAIALLLLGASRFVGAGIDEPGVPGTPSAICGQKSAAQIAAELRVRARNGIPDCPHALAPQSGVTTSGPSTLTDTGLTRCRVRDQAEVVDCPRGFTIHIETKRCRAIPAEDLDDQGAAAACNGIAIVNLACMVHHL